MNKRFNPFLTDFTVIKPLQTKNTSRAVDKKR